MTLHALDSVVAAQNQSLAIDCARGNHATLGGAVAGNRAGLDRLRHGTWRDHVLGARVMHADGSITQTGSRVVKSVSGYDLAKLYIGSQGSLVFLLDVNLRLLCRPQSVGAVRSTLHRATVADALRAVHADRSLQPSSILAVAEPGVERRADDIDVVVRFEGRQMVVAEQVQRCQQHLGGQVLGDEATRSLADALRQQCAPSTGRRWMRLLALPVGVIDDVLGMAAQLDAQSGFVAQYGVGVAHFVLSVAAWRVMRQMPHPDSGSSRLVWSDGHLRIAPTPALMQLQQSIRQSFDPRGVLVGGDAS
jgi:glycolate oxidase FAD binding subunit